jgi:hypothetical protein
MRMTEKSLLAVKNKQIADLEECLAGFMVIAALNGAYLSDELGEWASSKLKGKHRTPVQVWKSIVPGK